MDINQLGLAASPTQPQEGLAGSGFPLPNNQDAAIGMPSEQRLYAPGELANVDLGSAVTPLYEEKAKILANAVTQKQLAIKGNQQPTQPQQNTTSLDDFLNSDVKGDTDRLGNLGEDILQAGGTLLGATLDTAGDASARLTKEGYKYAGDMTEEEANKAIYDGLTFSKDWFDKDMNFTLADELQKPSTYNYDPSRVNEASKVMAKAWDSGSPTKMLGSIANALVTAGPEYLVQSLPQMILTRTPAGMIILAGNNANDYMTSLQKNMGTKDIGNLHRLVAIFGGAGSAWLERVGADEILGKTKFVNKLVGSIIATQPKNLARTTVRAVVNKAIKVGGQSGYEGLTEVAQNSIEAFITKYGNSKEGELTDGTLGRDNFVAFGAAVASTGVMKAPGSGLSMVASPITGAVGKQARLNKRFKNATSNVEAGFNTKDEQQAYTEHVDNNAKVSKDTLKTYSANEQSAKKLNSANNPIHTINSLQGLLRQNPEIDNTSAMSKILNFGRKELGELTDAISSNEALADKVSEELRTQINEASPLEAQAIIGNFLAQNKEHLDGTTKSLFNGMTTSLESQAKALVDDGSTNISYNNARQTVGTTKNINEYSSKVANKKKSAVQDSHITVGKVNSKAPGLFGKIASLVRPTEITKELSKYSGDTLKSLKKQANQAITKARNESNGTGLTGKYKASKSVAKAKAIVSSIDKLTHTRKSLKKTYTPQKTVGETIKDYVAGKFADLKAEADSIKAEKAKEDSTPNQPGSTKADTRTKEQKRKDKNRKTPAEKKAMRAEMRKEALKVAKEVDSNIDDIKAEEIPIVEEILDSLNDVSESTTKYVKKLKDKLVTKAAELKAKKDSRNTDKMVDDQVATKDISKTIGQLAKQILTTSKTATRSDAKQAMGKLGKLINSKLTTTERIFIAKMIARGIEGGKFTSAFTTKYVDKLNDSIDENMDEETKADLRKSISKTLGSAYMDSKKLAKKVFKALRTLNGRQKLESGVDQKIDDILSGKTGEDISNFMAEHLTYSEQMFLQDVVNGSDRVTGKLTTKGKAILEKILDGVDFNDKENPLTKKELLGLLTDKLKLTFEDVVDTVKQAGTQQGRQDLENTISEKFADMQDSELGKEFSKDYNSIIDKLTKGGRDSKAAALKEFKKFKQKYKDTTPLDIYNNLKDIFRESKETDNTSEVVDSIDENDINVDMKDC